MTEAEWLTAADLSQMLESIKVKASHRKLRLFSVGCCHATDSYIRKFFPNKRKSIPVQYWEAIRVAEDFADGLILETDLAKAYFNADNRFFHAGLEEAFHTTAHSSSWQAAIGVVTTLMDSYWDDGESDFGRTCLAEVFGNPFRSITLNPAWLTSTVVSLANGIYEQKAFDRLPILADALQDARCDNDDILNHCRQPGEHCRGCWCVDLLLGKC